MPDFMVHFTGSIPFANAGEVFETVGRELGPALLRLPDGETGARSGWLNWFNRVITDNPRLERTDEVFRPHPTGNASFRYRLRPGVAAEEVSFAGLPHAKMALESYAIFKRLKEAGLLPRRLRFQFTVAHPIPVIRRYFPEALQDALEPRFEEALFQEIASIAAAIPHDELAVQWDAASAVFATLELGQPTRFGATREAMYDPLAARLIRAGRVVPPSVELLYHFCYGNSGGRHSVEPSSTRDAVAMANRVSAGLSRPLQLIHLPVPIARHDDAYFAPLQDLALGPETAIALGLVHLSDGVDGAARRIAAARRYLPSFLIATECGLSHVPPDRLLEVLRLHGRIAGLA